MKIDMCYMAEVPAACPDCGTMRDEAPGEGCLFHIHHDWWFADVLTGWVCPKCGGTDPSTHTGGCPF